VADVQTISVSGGSGTLGFTIVSPLGQYRAVYNVTLAILQAALQALYGTGNILVTGTPGTTYTITGAGALLTGPLPLLVIASVDAGLTVTIAHTTIGITQNNIVAYNGALLAAPAAAPSVSGTGAGGSIGAGTYLLTYTYKNAQGETTESPGAFVTLTASQSILVATITGLAAVITSVNFYIDGQFIANQATSGGATGAVTISAVNAGAPVYAPTSNTAYSVSDGSQVPVGVLKDPINVDIFGTVTLGTTSGVETPANPQGCLVWICGYFLTQNLTGLDANAVSKLGKLITGTTTSGLIKLT